ncbi:hypothetical protein [uncultured Bacteroides sp.]|uniref:hypothetical protein n=1 Tax=uncultured Bacteroides sp. TaxID=162156 RepID=UPI002AAAB55B|nr:hypothetical protein [uncultured Bacteroides sp.]
MIDYKSLTQADPTENENLCNKVISNILYQTRNFLKLSRPEVAAMSGICVETVLRIERGHNCELTSYEKIIYYYKDELKSPLMDELADSILTLYWTKREYTTFRPYDVTQMRNIHFKETYSKLERNYNKCSTLSMKFKEYIHQKSEK